MLLTIGNKSCIVFTNMKITMECNSELFIKILESLVFRDRLFNVKCPERYEATLYFYITTLYHARKIYL